MSHVTKKGYVRIGGARGEKAFFEHVVVWERAHGRPKPHGMEIHHRDFDKTNNDPNNLQLVTPTEHSRIHGGCELRDGGWWKPCRDCGEMKPITREHWYFARRSPNWPHFPWCKSCQIKRAVACKQRRKRLAAAALAAG